jgi:hypothetical protein
MEQTVRYADPRGEMLSTPTSPSLGSILRAQFQTTIICSDVPPRWVAFDELLVSWSAACGERAELDAVVRDVLSGRNARAMQVVLPLAPVTRPGEVRPTEEERLGTQGSVTVP